MDVVGGQKKKSDVNYVDHRRNLFCNELAFLRLRLDSFSRFGATSQSQWLSVANVIGLRCTNSFRRCQDQFPFLC